VSVEKPGATSPGLLSVSGVHTLGGQLASVFPDTGATVPKTVPVTPSAPGAMGPYSVVTEANGFVFVSGQVAVDPITKERSPDDVEEQTSKVMTNITAILGDLGLGITDIVKTTIFLADINDFPKVNEVYAGFLDAEPPARSTVQAGALPGGFLVEIEVVAAR
jgi:2-iminobutanoate/2-iminopropanoate deaminase